MRDIRKTHPYCKQITLRELRKGIGMSRKRLAILIGCNYLIIHKLEKDSSNITHGVLSKYIELFQVSYDDVYIGKEREIQGERKKILAISMQKGIDTWVKSNNLD